MSKTMMFKDNICINTLFHTQMDFLILVWAIDRCADIIPGKNGILTGLLPNWKREIPSIS